MLSEISILQSIHQWWNWVTDKGFFQSLKEVLQDTSIYDFGDIFSLILIVLGIVIVLLLKSIKKTPE